MKHSPGFLKLVVAAKKKIKEMTVPDLKERLRQGKGPVVIDVREDHEWEDSHISGAVHFGRGILERDIEKAIPDKKKEIVLYCGGGFRSALSAENLKKIGYRNVFSLKGGWKAWKRSKGAIDR